MGGHEVFVAIENVLIFAEILMVQSVCTDPVINGTLKIKKKYKKPNLTYQLSMKNFEYLTKLSFFVKLYVGFVSTLNLCGF